MSKIKPDQLASEIIKTLEEYKDVTQESADKAANSVRKSGAKQLRSASPRSNIVPSGRKHYADNWTSKSQDRKGHVVGVIHNLKPTYRVAHLLEKGTPNMGAQVHIKPVEEQVIKEFEEKIKRDLK